MPDQDGLDLARRQRDDLRPALTAQQTAQAKANRALADARSRFGDDDERTAARRAAVERAATVLDETQKAYATARDRVVAVLRARLDRDIGDDFAALETSRPLVLLPVRIETRFATGGDAPELWIRIFPDEIHADSHERELTTSEVDAGRAYWTAIWRDPDAGLTAWQTLLQIVPTPRAAWVVLETTPRNVGSDHAEADPDFPDPALKIGDWTRAVEARLLPDRFVALGFRGGQEVARHPGNAIVEPLAVTLAPDASASQRQDVSGDGLEVDEAVRWTVDFDRAVEIGMGMRMPITGVDLEDGFDELLVVGVKGSLPPESTSAELTTLFEEHHYGRGLAFLAQGTPTNNTERAPSGYPPTDPHGERSFAIELDDTRSVVGKDGERFARGLGIHADALAHVDRSDADEQSSARAMAGALWPATWGYLFEELLFADDLNDEVDAFRDYFIEHVRARGHHPVFRVGSTPYGVVVASSLTSWQNRGRRGLIENAMPDDLRRLRDIWREALPNVPHIGRTADPDRDLLDVLEMDASAREVRVRSVVGPNASLNMAGFFGLNWDPVRVRQLELANRLAQRLGRNNVASLIFSLTFGKTASTFAHGLVVPRPTPDAPEPLGEADTLPFNYIRWLREAGSIEDVRQERLPTGVSPPNTLLYLLLRHAMLREAARTADTILVKGNIVSRALTKDHELVGATFATAAPPTAAAPIATTTTVWDRLQMIVPPVTGNQTLAAFVWADAAPRPETQRLRDYREFLRTLEGLPTAELERLLTETLDVCSHRLDAWITSMFEDRLVAMRGDGGQPSVVGAFGWVMNLRAKPATATTTVTLPKLGDEVRRRLGSLGASLPQQTSTGGFVHTPSMVQAATAAVLRNGFLSRRTVNDQRYGVDLSSTRVRRARFILDAVRQGQSLGAVLGYQFERGLHEEHRPLPLDRYKEPFRRAYPIVADKLTATDSADGESVEAVAARNVVDGLALHAAWLADTIEWGADGKPVRPGEHFTAVDAELRRLDETIAVADVLMAESVFQLVRGNTSGASSSLDALARGVRAPDPEVIRTPRGGTALTHRVALILGGTPIVPAGWASVPVTPRAQAEPHLDGWLGVLLGDPARIRCLVSYTDTANVVKKFEVTLKDLGLRPLDVLHAVAAAHSEPQQNDAKPTTTAEASELDARVAAVALARSDANPDGELGIAYAPTDRASTRSFPEIAELLRGVQAVLSTARALEPKDLLASAQIDQLPDAVVDAAGIGVRATTALAALIAARDALVTEAAPLAVDPTPVNPDRTRLVEALRHAALFGLPGAFEAVPHTDVATGAEAAARQQLRTRDLVERAASVAGEMTKRIEASTAEPAAAAKLAQVFGAAFQALTPFTPAGGALGQALTQGPTPPPSRADIRGWFRGASLVRGPLDRYHRFTLLQRALGSTPAAPTVAQVPHVPGAAWVAMPFADEAGRPVSGTLALALLAANGAIPGAADRWTGLFLDEWTELVPSREESTAIAFHYDDPGAEAAHAVIVAVPPDNATNWTLERVADVLRETLEMARLRAVDGDLLGTLSQLLPATYLASNSRFDTVAVQFDGLIQKDAVILQSTP